MKLKSYFKLNIIILFVLLFLIVNKTYSQIIDNELPGNQTTISTFKDFLSLFNNQNEQNEISKSMQLQFLKIDRFSSNSFSGVYALQSFKVSDDIVAVIYSVDGFSGNNSSIFTATFSNKGKFIDKRMISQTGGNKFNYRQSDYELKDGNILVVKNIDYHDDPKRQNETAEKISYDKYKINTAGRIVKIQKINN